MCVLCDGSPSHSWTEQLLGWESAQATWAVRTNFMPIAALQDPGVQLGRQEMTL